ncbi:MULTISPECIES: type II secretion system protein GspM [Pseudomonas]|jgi:general secretion pathway protein M|uniref:type II secretion system protein GspM n=1 Tax=Pseudomonas TaxID=286 RepID=UPI001472FCEC|nr:MULTISPECIES: type II secretion system protein GspM [Pseudomonas]MBX4135340.1 type II secretion system protein M [Pseudomonas sp. S5F11]NMZ19584.1 type II secretion system protein M [Pseudomonas rhodesiae]QVN09231.1 type II secretion system protein M [Pseudomonas rhodesiae]UVL11025.1 type II secretion system protein M [Pseudomonas rhodesiae]
MNKWLRVRGQAQVFWAGLAQREKRLLIGAGLLLASLLTWLVLVQPALKKIAYWQAETPKLRAQAEALQVLLQDVAAPQVADDNALRQALDGAGLHGHYQLQTLDPGAWRLTFDNAPADAALGWLLGNVRTFSLEVSEARLQRAGDAVDNSAGTVSGTVRMDQALGAKDAS